VSWACLRVHKVSGPALLSITGGLPPRVVKSYPPNEYARSVGQDRQMGRRFPNYGHDCGKPTVVLGKPMFYRLKHAGRIPERDIVLQSDDSFVRTGSRWGTFRRPLPAQGRLPPDASQPSRNGPRTTGNRRNSWLVPTRQTFHRFACRSETLQNLF
jgi:hypothetical protein